jgi:hypothetical protein
MRSITRSVGCVTLWALVVYLFVKGALVLVPRQFVLAISALIAALVHVCSGSAAPSSDGGGTFEEGRQRDLVSVSEGHQCPEGSVGLAAFDHAEVLGVDGGSFGSLLLRQPLLIPHLSKAQAEPLLSPPDGSLDGGPLPDLRGAVGTVGR